jgi:hypothetical protein
MCDYPFPDGADDLVGKLVRYIRWEGVSAFLPEPAVPERASPKNAQQAQKRPSGCVDIFR